MAARDLGIEIRHETQRVVEKNGVFRDVRGQKRAKGIECVYNTLCNCVKLSTVN